MCTNDLGMNDGGGREGGSQLEVEVEVEVLAVCLCDATGGVTNLAELMIGVAVLSAMRTCRSTSVGRTIVIHSAQNGVQRP
jgi:hypothetical protein